ncbi:MAG: 3-hydroxyacyl-ACP dehydratase FabZ family protein [Candidatus Comchoanobacterales bacterium]
MTYNLKDLIPHREPFLHINRIISLTENDCVTEKDIDPKDPIFKGHFPDNPVYPGVLSLEAMGQASGCLLSHMLGDKTHFLFASSTGNRFFQPILPNVGTLTVKATLKKKRGLFYWFTCSVSQGDQVFTSCEICLVLAKKHESLSHSL